MLLVSKTLDLASRLLGPRVAFQIQLMRWRRWNKVEPEWLLLDRLVDPTRASVDVGGNQGVYAGRLAQLSPRVHCFEPIPWLAERIASRLSPRRTCVHQVALSDRDGEALLRIPYTADGAEMNEVATLEAGNAILAQQASVRTVPCRLARLDAIVREPVGFIKIDVEGHELAVLHGALGILERDRPTLLVESQRITNAEAPGNVIAFLASLGYAGYFYEAGRRRDADAFDLDTHQKPDRPGQPFVYNFIFVPSESAPGRLPTTLS